MTARLPIWILGVAALGATSAQDTLFFHNGTRRIDEILSVKDGKFLVRRNLAKPGEKPVLATATIPRQDVAAIAFGEDPARERLLAGAPPLEDLARLWERWEPFLAIPKSPAGRVANAYGEGLLATERKADARNALRLFKSVEASAWSEEDRMRAKQGRLRAMIATGQAAGAVREAAELAKISEDPSVLVEAKFILGAAADRNLRALIKDNPRWEEDIFVIPERDRLYNEALDHYLFASLFFGSDAQASARGLWAAAIIFRFTNEPRRALECARDIVSLYPETPCASEARAYMESLPQAFLEENPEMPVARPSGEKAAAAPTASPEATPKLSKKSKSRKKTKKRP